MIDQSENFEIERLVGMTLNQIRVGLYQVAFCFDNDTTVSCDSEVFMSKNGGRKRVFPSPEAILPLIDLLGEQATKTRFDESGGLSIDFQNGTKVDIPTDVEGYEAFQVWIGNDFLIA